MLELKKAKQDLEDREAELDRRTAHASKGLDHALGPEPILVGAGQCAKLWTFRHLESFAKRSHP